MGLLDKMRTGAEQAAEKVKSGAEQAAERAREEIEELQKKRELDQTFGELGKKVLELADRSEPLHAELSPLIDKARSLKAQL